MAEKKKTNTARKSVEVKAKELRWGNTTWRKKRQLQENELFGMRPTMDFGDLTFHYLSDAVKNDLIFKSAIESMTVDRTIEGGSTITIVLRDPNARIFSEAAGRMRPSKKGKYKENPPAVDEDWQPLNLPDLIGRAVEIKLDGVTFRLTKVGYAHKTEQLTLTFEDRIVYWLRRKYGAKHVSRQKATRAQFILSLVREVKAEKVPFISPALKEKQKIAEAE